MGCTDTDTWERFSRTVDYRREASTKPHNAHPNQVYRLGDETWATRFEQRDALCLTDRSRRIDIAIERVHDGDLHEGRLYFTTVNGRIVVADPDDLRVVDVKEARPGRRDEILGLVPWYPLEDGNAWLGFSRVRPTKTRENVGFVLRGFRKDLGTRIAQYDLATMDCRREINLEDAGLGAVFSIVPRRGMISERARRGVPAAVARSARLRPTTRVDTPNRRRTGSRSIRGRS